MNDSENELDNKANTNYHAKLGTGNASHEEKTKAQNFRFVCWPWCWQVPAFELVGCDNRTRLRF
jgi:hypothetical protein